MITKNAVILIGQIATILTLIFLPTLYVAWFGGKEVPSDPRLKAAA
jgi:multidrug efflux pump